MSKNRRILVLSADAMVCEDLQELKKKENFGRYLKGGCEAVHGMRTIYPSVTYPAHVSMITGCYAGKHGVVSNFDFTTSDKDQSWRWFGGYDTEDIFKAAKKAGLTTGAVSWPGTAGNASVDWLMAEYWMPNPGDTLAGSFRDAGSSEAMIDIIERNACYLPKGYEKGGKSNFMQWPQVDEFIIQTACTVIREHAPQVMFVHTGAFDSCRHAHGVFSPFLERPIADLDRYLGLLMDAYRQAGVLDEVNLVLVSDHGQRDICRIVNLNVLLADAGLIHTDMEGKVTDWEAFSFSNAMSSLIYLKNPDDEILKKRVYERLKFLCEEGVYGIGQVFTKEEIREKEQLDGDFSFVVESDGYTSFADGVLRPLVKNCDNRDYRYGQATHGYLPDLGPQPVFVAKGPDFCENVTIDRGNIIDEAPTYARLLGIPLEEAQGQPICCFLKEKKA